ncbi:surface antigen BspA-like [Trichomonas vaginalis G3]|uniref:Surface antigen BspA-like n=1 Tax=Trichomonas vaginalis (strain ATCC PRA-98 / G3) TaxID=412133 RepID=A2DXU2_TRIV3|nr:surface antigen BspA-like [Trichomonas vaginalis G3]|eukprot:XP_001327025.1 surface antigen BspA-like [Trichomonas vaginalis G3]
MLILFTILTNYKEINASCYSRDFKTLNKVEDTYPNLIISAKCEIIADDCFKNMISLLSFTFEDNPNLTTIGGYSFNGCINLTNINLSSCIKLKTVKYNAFDGCKNAAYILLPKGIIDIQSSAFASNYVMTNLTIPASVEKIGNCAFMYCLKLKTLIFEDGSNLTSLSRYVFYACDFHTFEIPENVSKVHGMLFNDGWLSNITVNPKNPFLKVVNKTVFSANMNILYYFCKKPTPTFEIPSSVTTLEASLFQEGTISSITFPNTLTTIGNDCFHDSRITSIVIPENIGCPKVCLAQT